MSGDTNARNHRRLVDRDFHLHSLSSAIECGSGTGQPGGGGWRSEPGLAAGKTEGRSGAAAPESGLALVDNRQRSDDTSGPKWHRLAVALMPQMTVWGWRGLTHEPHTCRLGALPGRVLSPSQEPYPVLHKHVAVGAIRRRSRATP